MFFNLPTLLTWGRIVSIPLVVGVYYLHLEPATQNILGTALFIIVALTDWADGYLARRLKMTSSFGFFCTANERGDVEGFFISDNVIEGPSTWPRTKGIETARAIEVTGVGHDICHNRLRGFADGVDTMPSAKVAAKS